MHRVAACDLIERTSSWARATCSRQNNTDCVSLTECQIFIVFDNFGLGFAAAASDAKSFLMMSIAIFGLFAWLATKTGLKFGPL